jgi:hypothetical protein
MFILLFLSASNQLPFENGRFKSRISRNGVPTFVCREAWSRTDRAKYWN